MKKKYLLSLTVIVLVFLGMVWGQEKVFAANSTFTHEVIFPENQIDDSVGYYYLKMEPSQKQVLEIKLANPGSEKVTVDVAINGAKTNSNGIIEYANATIKEDESVKFPFTDIVTAPKKVDLKPGEETILKIEVNMPETKFDGEIAGGVQLIQEGQEAQQKAQGATVINEYAYTTGIVIKETDVEVLPALKLNTVKAGQANSKNAIFVNYSNVNAAYLENMTAEAQISKKENATVLYEKKQTKMRMAPNTQFNFTLDLAGEKMEAGDYTAHILVTGDKDIREDWTKDFKITEEEANKYNERDVGLVQEKGLDWKLVIIIVISIFATILIIFSIIYFIRKNSKKKKVHHKKRK